MEIERIRMPAPKTRAKPTKSRVKRMPKISSTLTIMPATLCPSGISGIAAMAAAFIKGMKLES